MLGRFRRGSEPVSQFSHSPSSIQHYDLAVKRKDTVMLETPSYADNNPVLHEGLHVKDYLVSGYDQIANISVLMICVTAAIGIGAGVVLAKFQVSGDWATWIALPGDLFINALKCLIVPMVFCSVVVCIGELIEIGKAAAIGGRTVIYFVSCSILSSSIGVLMGVIFSSQFKAQIKSTTAKPVPKLSMRCASGGYVTGLGSGVLSCLASNATDGSSLFRVNDTSSFFAVGSTKYAKLSVTDQLFSIFRDLVPENIVGAFANSTAISIIIFAICFGIALVRSVDRNKEGDNYPLLLITHANIICRLLVNHVISFIPIAIVSMIAGSMAQYSSSSGVLATVGWLIVALFAGLFLLTIVILGGALYITTGRFIFSWLKFIFPAMVFIFGCSSSIATLPITLRCVESSREVSFALGRFVLPLGATTNLNGTAVYMPLACIFMAKVGGLEDLLTPTTYILLIIVGAISSFGVAPVPHAGLAMVITVWRTVFGMDVPQVFTLLVGADWILNRMRSIVNITNDTIICRIIAQQCGETEFLRNPDRGETVVQTSGDPMSESLALSP